MQVTKDPLKVVADIVARYPQDTSSAIPILQEIQNEIGYVSPEFIKKITELTGIPTSDLYGIVTFYSQFRLEPLGKHHIQVCNGTACHLAQSEKITEVFESETKTKSGSTSADGMYTIEQVACLGCCSMGPVANVDGEIIGKLTADKVKKIVKDTKKQENGDQ